MVQYQELRLSVPRPRSRTSSMLERERDDEFHVCCAIRDHSSGVGLPPEVDRETSCTATAGSAKRRGHTVLRHSRRVGRRDRLRASVAPYSATVAPIPIEPATQIHSTRPKSGSCAISRPGMHHRSVSFPRGHGCVFETAAGSKNVGVTGGRENAF